MATSQTAPSTSKTDQIIFFDPYDRNLIVDEKDNGRYAPYTSEDVIDLREDIRVHGILEPVLAYRLPKKQVRLFAGFGRVKAARDLKDAGEGVRVPVRLFDLNEKDAFLRNISENQRRRSTTAVDEAHSIRRLSEVFGMTDEEIRKTFAKNNKPMSPAWVHERKKILRLSPDLQKKGHDENLAASVLIGLAEIPEQHRSAVLKEAEHIAVQETVRETAAEVGMQEEEVHQLVEEAKQIVQATTDAKVKAVPAEKIEAAVSKAAERRGLSKAKAKKLGAGVKKAVRPKPEKKHIDKAATRKGGVVDKRVRKFSDLKERIEEYSAPGNRDYPANMRKAFLYLDEWCEGGRTTEDLNAALVKIFKAA